DLAERVWTQQGRAMGSYGDRKASYDLRKLRGKSLVERVGKTRRYWVRRPGIRTLAALLILREQVIKPVLAGVCRPKRGRPPSSHFSQRDHIEGCKRRECFHLDNPGGSALLSRRQTGNWTPMAAIRLCTSQCPIRRRSYSLVADSDNPQISAA